MGQRQSQLLRWSAAGVATALLMFAFLQVFYWSQWPVPQSEVGNNQTALGGTSWAEWEDTPEGVVMRRLLPPSSLNPYLGSSYLQPGDRLLTLDQQPIPRAEWVEAVFRNAKPGTVFWAQIARPRPADQSIERHTLFIVAGYAPPLMESRSGTFWQFSFLSYALYGLTALVLLLLLWPFLRVQFRRHVWLFGFLASTLLFLVIQITRYIAVVLDSQGEAPQFALVTGLLAGGAWWAQAALLPFSGSGPTRGGRWFTALQAAFGVGAVIVLCLGAWPNSVFHRNYGSGEFLLEIFFLAQFTHFLIFDTEPTARWQRILQWSLAGLALGLAALLVFGWNGPNQIGPFQALAEYLVVALLGGALAFSAGLVLRFGKVSRIVGQALVLAVALVLLGISYLITSSLLADFTASGPLRRVVEFAVIALLVLVGGWALLRLRRTWAALPWFGTQRRDQQLAALLGRIPRHTHSFDLLKDVTHELRQYTGTAQVEFWLPIDTAKAVDAEDDTHETSETSIPSFWAESENNLILPPPAQLALLIDSRARFWASRTEVSETELPPPIANVIRRAGIQLLFPLRFSNQSTGLLAIGGRASDVFNLEELERLERVVQQTQLTLDILQLLEKEKDLVQKTMEANMTALRSQINPHFLFNTLNTISALVHDAPDEAEKAVEKLAYIFRHTLKFSADNFVPLETELKLVRSYLDIEQMRFGKRLAVRITADPVALNTPIPTLILQTLVENCIKHGIAKITKAGRVEIDVTVNDNQVRVEVYDNGPGIDLSRLDKSTGLVNVRARLEKLYNSRDLIRFINTGDGTRVELVLPLKAG